ncbi:dienelactone hydrolase family protein [Kaistia dalseonensis]|uniref:Phospholipase/carboxylesterase n=1 Tax=Kaistia dalseonensis TaxID=410840 RepID=A0ABU0H1W5_9HYPH|nr:dienelactone hydrolase family protein [Kaistia dalseonensis]MCX5493727.1 dienelactone hydrolase family protein [Kaistia dalseonensis]MDQ0436291.1 phospholipase/carboxylesterase [Kaistia dalseonensis]
MNSGSGPLRLGSRGSEAKAICVFVHGRGQSPEEMQSHVLARLSAPSVAFVLPRAPLGAWWDARAVEPLTPVARAQLSAALDHLAAALAAARGELPGRPLLLAGFSQGACLAIEYLCAGLPPPDALAAFTGCRVGVATDARSEAAPAGTTVYLSGGDADPWIPVSAFADAAQSLGGSGVRLRADLFPGRGHEVSDSEIAMLDGMLADLAAGRNPRMEAAR